MLIPEWLRLDELFGDDRLPDATLWLRDGALEVISRVASIRAPVTNTHVDFPGCLPPLALRLAREFELHEAAVTRRSVTLEGLGRIERPRPRLEPSRFGELTERLLAGEPLLTIALDAALLARVAVAMGADLGITVALRTDEDALYVRPREPWLDAEAIVMPMRLDWLPGRGQTRA